MSTHHSQGTPTAGTAYLSVNGSAEYLSLSRWTIYKLIRDGELRAFRVGSRLRLRISDLDAYAERGSP